MQRENVMQPLAAVRADSCFNNSSAHLSQCNFATFHSLFLFLFISFNTCLSHHHFFIFVAKNKIPVIRD